MLCFLRDLPDAVSAESAGIHFFAVARMDPGLNFHAREWPHRASARSAAASRGCLGSVGSPGFSGQEEKEIQQKDNMKYLLMILATVAMIGTASAAPRNAAASCCNGGACCKANSACCKAHTPDKK